MRNIILIGGLAVAGCISAAQRQDEAPSGSPISTSLAKPNVTETAAPTKQGLTDLDAMTFDCPKAGLNAAAREAAKVPSQGTYQFSYFRIINDAHHAAYEVYFKSNYIGEPELRYCISMYCQQGWNPNETKIDVRLMSDEPPGAAARTIICGEHSDAREQKHRR